MYFLIGLILALIVFFLWAGPVVTYIQEEDTGEKFDDLAQVYASIWEGDPDDVFLLLKIGAFLAFLCLFIWPLFIFLAIITVALYFIGSNPVIKTKTRDIIEKIGNVFQEEKQDASHKEEKSY